MIKEGFEIVELSNCHLSAVAALEASCFSCPISEKNLANILLGGIGKGFVCIDTKTQEIAAYGGVIAVAGEAQVLNIATGLSYRRMGLAGAVVEAIIDYSVSNNAEYITLEVRESNASAISLYKKFDFYEVGRIKKYYSSPVEDALILKKELSSNLL